MHFATGNDCSVPPLLPTSLLAKPHPVLSFITKFWAIQQASSYLLKSFFLERSDFIRETELLILGCLLGPEALERALLSAASRAGLFYLISTTTSGSQGRGSRFCHSDVALELLQNVWAPGAPELWVTKWFWRNCCPQLWGWGDLRKHCSSPYGQKGSFQVAADADFLGRCIIVRALQRADAAQNCAGRPWKRSHHKMRCSLPLDHRIALACKLPLLFLKVKLCSPFVQYLEWKNKQRYRT